MRNLDNGPNLLTARIGDGRTARARIVSHPNGGPVFSGPQIQPWVCQETAVDRRCNQPVEFELRYKPEEGSDLVPYDQANPPDDVATTTTDEGVEVPFIVRIEKGYQDRDQYKIAQLYQPGEPWKPWDPQEQWNHKLVVTHGFGCGADYGAGNAPAVHGALSVGIPGVDDIAAALSGNLGVEALGRGFAVASTALNNNSHNCNIAVQAESMVMLKEHLIESYGPIRYTIASGCSGGSVVQQQVANAYPGIYQGLTPQCSYPDTFSPGAQFADYYLLRQYFENPDRWGPGIAWLPTQFGEVEGHLAHLNAILADEGLFQSAINPEARCSGVTEAQVYDFETNPGGVRCDILSYMINVLGPRPKDEWIPFERKFGPGPGIPFGNVGIQYGLEALMDLKITKSQFLDLNESIGGISKYELAVTEERLHQDNRSLRNSYRSGAFNEANNLDQVAIINLGGPDPGAAHDYSHAFFMRARLLREQNGELGNYVMWFGNTPILGDPSFHVRAFLAMDRWLAAVEADERKIPLAEKILEDRPADIENRCETVPGIDTGVQCLLDATQTKYGTPRTISGAGIASDIGACTLEPLVRSEHPVSFSDAEWARMEKIFPEGVCDWSKPGVEQRDTIAWLNYQQPDRDVIHGGKRMGRAPKRSGSAWTSPAFGNWIRPPA